MTMPQSTIDMTDEKLSGIHSSGTTDYGRVKVVMKSTHYAITLSFAGE